MAPTIDPDTMIGLVSLSVADLDRSLDYYEHALGLALLGRENGEATLGAGERALLHLREQPGARLVRRATGLYHFALRVPSRRELARVLAHFAEASTRIDGASDHLVSEAIYLSDPDGHGIEVYRDRPRDQWRSSAGSLQMATLPLDIRGVLGELEGDASAWNGLHPDTDMGHIHLQVADVAAAEGFYCGVLGFERMATYPGASFISAGGYHHHIGMNTWAGAGVPAPPASAARLLRYEITLPSPAALEDVLGRVRAAQLPFSQAEHGWEVADPSHNTVVLR